MGSSERGAGAPRATWAGRGGTPDVSHAVAERERGRRRLNATTVTVSLASVAAAGAVAAGLPGSTHTTVTDTGSSPAGSHAGSAGSSSTGTAGSSSTGTAGGSGPAGSSGSSPANSSSSSGSPNLQAPTYVPVQSNGGGQVTSGGTH